jgi:hypothetical protein
MLISTFCCMVVSVSMSAALRKMSVPTMKSVIDILYTVAAVTKPLRKNSARPDFEMRRSEVASAIG